MDCPASHPSAANLVRTEFGLVCSGSVDPCLSQAVAASKEFVLEPRKYKQNQNSPQNQHRATLGAHTMTSSRAAGSPSCLSFPSLVYQPTATIPAVPDALEWDNPGW